MIKRVRPSSHLVYGETVILKAYLAPESSGGLAETISWGLRVCMSTAFPSNAGAEGLAEHTVRSPGTASETQEVLSVAH